MINHVRTLLLNRNGTDLPQGEGPGEVFVPAEFKRLLLPGWLQRLREGLFGRNPDRAYLNYRIQELLQLVHSTELEEYVYQYDPRVTYIPFPNGFYEQPAGISAQLIDGVGDLFCSGPATTTKPLLYNQWEVEFVTLNNVIVRRESPPISSEQHSVAYNYSLTQQLPLHGSSYKFQGSSIAAGSKFLVTATSTPSMSLGQVLANIDASSGNDIANLFASPASEPMLTYKQLWYNRPAFPYRAAALTLAIAQRTEAVRVGEN